MKIWYVFIKNMKEQYRSLWLLILTISTAPFFVLVYYLITQSYVQQYRVLIVNNDRPVMNTGEIWNYSEKLIANALHVDSLPGLVIKTVHSIAEGNVLIRNKKADVLVVLPEDFSAKLAEMKSGMTTGPAKIEFSGDITGMKYMIGSVLFYNILSSFISRETGIGNFIELTEKPVGLSGDRTDFELAVPGLLIFSIIMLMLSASSAMIYESENNTLTRLKIARVPVAGLLGGISAVQLIVGILSVALTLFMALLFGFRYEGSLWLVLPVSVLTSLSMISFCLIIAAFTKTVTQVLIVGNFPLFIFMFFSGAMFPVNARPWFEIGHYEVSVISLMSPSHAISALNKVMLMQEGFSAIIPELVAILLLSVLYAAVGGLFYYRRHLRID